jgi:hypothetical protein
LDTKNFELEEITMKKVFLVLLLVGIGSTVFAGGTMDASKVSDADIARIDKIAQDLEPTVAIQTALTTFKTSSYPLSGYLKTQKMKIDLVFNEYGVEFSEYTSYEGLSQKAQVSFSRLKSRYSYLSSMTLNDPDELRAALTLLK